VPVAATLRVAELLRVTFGDAGCPVMAGGAQIVTVAAVLFATWQPVTRTQYVVVEEGVTVSEGLFVPTGVVVTPTAPMYHWYARPSPVAETLSVVDWPLLMRTFCGLVRMFGMHVATVAVLLSTVQVPSLTRTQ
jgi:hypothetical protein